MDLTRKLTTILQIQNAFSVGHPYYVHLGGQVVYCIPRKKVKESRKKRRFYVVERF